MTSITYGEENIFNSTNTSDMSIDVLDDEKFVIIYKEISPSIKIMVIIGTITGETISYGTPVELTTGTSYNLDVATLDSTHFVVCYGDCARVGSVAGTTITLGSENSFHSDPTYGCLIKKIDSSHFLIAYDAQLSTLTRTRLAIGAVSGITITAYYGYITVDTQITITQLTMLDSTHLVVAYRDDDIGYVKVGSIAGTSITLGTASKYHDNKISYSTIATIDSSHFIINYHDDLDNKSYIKIGVVSGITVSSYGTIFEMPNATHSSIAMLDSKYFILSYNRSSNGRSVIGIIDDTTIVSHGYEYQFNITTTTKIDNVLMSNGRLVMIVYRDDGDSTYGCGVVSKFYRLIPTIIMS